MESFVGEIKTILPSYSTVICTDLIVNSQLEVQVLVLVT